jgi:hypothetical protein
MGGGRGVPAPSATRRAEARPRPGPSALPPTRSARAQRCRCAARVVRSSQCQTAQFLRSRVRCCVGVSLLPVRSTRPHRGVGGAPGGSSLELVALVSARRHACEAWALPRNREAASRRSTVALSAQGPLPLPALLPAPVRRLHATGRVCPAAGPRRFVSAVYEPRSTPLPAPPADASGDAPHERG